MTLEYLHFTLGAVLFCRPLAGVLGPAGDRSRLFFVFQVVRAAVVHLVCVVLIAGVARSRGRARSRLYHGLAAQRHRGADRHHGRRRSCRRTRCGCGYSDAKNLRTVAGQ